MKTIELKVARIGNSRGGRNVKRYEIRWAALDPMLGAEMAKRTSPAWRRAE